MYLKLNNKEFTLFYNSKDYVGKQTLAYSKTFGDKINRQDINNAQISSTVLRKLVDILGVEPRNLLNKSHPYYQKNLKGKNFDDEDWLTIIQQNLYLIKAPIAYNRNRAVLCETPTDIFKMDRSSVMV